MCPPGVVVVPVSEGTLFRKAYFLASQAKGWGGVGRGGGRLLFASQTGRSLFYLYVGTMTLLAWGLKLRRSLLPPSALQRLLRVASGRHPGLLQPDHRARSPPSGRPIWWRGNMRFLAQDRPVRPGHVDAGQGLVRPSLLQGGGAPALIHLVMSHPERAQDSYNQMGSGSQV